jgi:hypothetical protein
LARPVTGGAPGAPAKEATATSTTTAATSPAQTEAAPSGSSK